MSIPEEFDITVTVDPLIYDTDLSVALVQMGSGENEVAVQHEPPPTDPTLELWVDLDPHPVILNYRDPVTGNWLPLVSGGTTGSLAYHHYQPSAATVWTINHGLGFYPNVAVVDSAHNEIVPEINYPSATQVVLTFSASVGGEAYLS